jgi:hypothetical protein
MVVIGEVRNVNQAIIGVFERPFNLALDLGCRLSFPLKKRGKKSFRRRTVGMWSTAQRLSKSCG